MSSLARVLVLATASSPSSVAIDGVLVPTLAVDVAELRARPALVELPNRWRFSLESPFEGPSLVETVRQPMSPLPGEWDGRGWFWIRLVLTGTTERERLLLWLRHLGDVEVYVDGELIGGSEQGPETGADLIARSPYELHLAPGAHVLAFHLRDDWGAALEHLVAWAGFAGTVGLPPSAFALHLEAHVRHEVFHGWIDGFALAMVLLHLALVVMRPNRGESILCGGSVLAFGAFMHLNFDSAHAETGRGVYTMLLVSNAFIAVGAALLPRFFVLATGHAPSRWLLGFQLLAIPLVLLLPSTGVGPIMIYGASAVLLIAVVLVRGHARKVQDLWLLTVGSGLFVVAALIEVLSWFGGLRTPEHVITYGFTALLVSMSVHVARDFARTEVESARRATALREAEARAAMAAELEHLNRELRDAQALLVHNEKMAALGQLAAGLSHEMNTPLGAISSGRQTMARGVERLRAVLREDADRAEMVLGTLGTAAGVVGDGASKVAAIVRKLKTFARLDEAPRQRFDLRQSVRDTEEILEPLWPASIQKRVHLPEPAYVVGSPGDLNQALYQVILNALQAQPEGGFVDIRCERSGSSWQIVIGDGGPGIGPDIRDRVFDPGFTTKGRGVGTGLGLSIVDRILRQHRGDVILSRAEGAGAQVILRIPAEPDEPSEETRAVDETAGRT